MMLVSVSAQAQEAVALEASPPPPVLQDLQEQTRGDAPDSSDVVGLQIRNDALKEAALSYGARGGLADIRTLKFSVVWPNMK